MAVMEILQLHLQEHRASCTYEILPGPSFGSRSLLHLRESFEVLHDPERRVHARPARRSVRARPDLGDLDRDSPVA